MKIRDLVHTGAHWCTLHRLPAGVIALTVAVLAGTALLGHHATEASNTHAPASSYRAPTVAPAPTSLLGKAAAAARGVSHPAPERIVVYDTIIREVKVPILGVQEGKNGQATITIATPSDSGGFRPEAETRDLGACDNGWTLAGGAFECRKAPFGHLELYGRAGGTLALTGMPAAGVEAAAGLRWTPSNRSPWSVELETRTDGRAAVEVRRALRIF